MAAIENSNHKSSSKKESSKRNSTRVDLTPMVDLGFLLITFFVFTTTMSRATVMKIDIPNDKTIDSNNVCSSCVLTVLLGNRDEINYYEGDLKTAQIKKTTYTLIRKIIQGKKETVRSIRGNADQFVLIIKATDEASFKNFVDITDEVTINNIKRYYIDEIKESEKMRIAAL